MTVSRARLLAGTGISTDWTRVPVRPAPSIAGIIPRGDEWADRTAVEVYEGVVAAMRELQK